MHLQHFCVCKSIESHKVQIEIPQGSADPFFRRERLFTFLFNFVSLNSALLPQVLALRGCALCYVSVYFATVSRAPQAERFLAHLDDPIMTGGN